MTISTSIPTTLRIPFVAVEIDNTKATQGPVLLPYRGLLIGQKTSGGSGTANTLYRVTSETTVIALAGRGSMLHRQYKAWSAENKYTECWILILADNGAGVAATGKLTFTGPATAAGTVHMYIAGDYVPFAVDSGDTDEDISAAAVAAITAAADLPVTAAVDGTDPEETNIAYRHKGLVGNELDIRFNYQDGEAFPAGVGCSIAAMASGTTNPTLTTAIAAMGDIWFHIIAHPYTDATSLTAIETELARRFGPLAMIDGVAFTGKAASHSSLITLGDGRNSPHSVIMPGQGSPTPPSEIGASAAGVVAYYANIDPARPLQTLPMTWVKPPAESARYTNTERNLLLHDGISTWKVGPGEVCQLERVVTTYQENGAGADDTSYLDVTSMLNLMYLRYSFRTQVQTKYPRHKLADNGTRPGPGQAVITPLIGKAEALLWFRQMETLGLVEGFDQFKRDLVVERNETDRNRLDFLLPPDLINQFIVAGVKLQFGL